MRRILSYWPEFLVVTVPIVTVLYLTSTSAAARPISGGDLSHTLDICLANGQGFQISNACGCCMPSGRRLN